MRGIFKLAGILLAVFLLIIVLTGTVSFIRYTWFGGGKSASGDHVQVVELSGVIINSQSIIKDIKSYLENKHTKALVLRVDSPGGLVAPSQEIFEMVKKADEKIPVVVSMGTVAASGGYYIALGGRKILANPGTMTASIGVIMEFANTQKLYQWAKMERFSITSGKFKDAGSPFKTMSPEDKALFQGLVTDIYSQFRGAVKLRRGLTDEELNKVADGRVVTGTQALAAKLVDGLGGLEDAVKEAKTLANLNADADVIYPHKSQGLLRKLIMGDDEDKGNGRSSQWLELLNTAAKNLPATSDQPMGPSWRILLMTP